MKHYMTLSLNINTSEFLGLYYTPTLKLSAKFCRSRTACLAQNTPQNPYTAISATQTNSQKVDIKHAGPQRKSCPQLWRAADQTNENPSTEHTIFCPVGAANWSFALSIHLGVRIVGMWPHVAPLLRGHQTWAREKALKSPAIAMRVTCSVAIAIVTRHLPGRLSSSKHSSLTPWIIFLLINVKFFFLSKGIDNFFLVFTWKEKTTRNKTWNQL